MSKSRILDSINDVKGSIKSLSNDKEGLRQKYNLSILDRAHSKYFFKNRNNRELVHKILHKKNFYSTDEARDWLREEAIKKRISSSLLGYKKK